MKRALVDVNVPTQAVRLLGETCQDDHHDFWPCAASILDASVVDGATAADLVVI